MFNFQFIIIFLGSKLIYMSEIVRIKPASNSILKIVISRTVNGIRLLNVIIFAYFPLLTGGFSFVEAILVIQKINAIK